MTLPRLTLDARELADLELIATGAAHPLTGFATEADYRRILAEQRLASGEVWPIPFLVALTDDEKDAVAAAGAAALHDAAGRQWGVLRATSFYQRDPIVEARALYGTDDVNHPGVAYTVSRPRWSAGGVVQLLPVPADRPFAALRLTPGQVRDAIAARGWRTVAGFETRGPIHRADEHASKLGLEACDGLVIHLLLDERPGELPPGVRVRAVEALVEHHYPRGRVLVVALPASIRHAGPREALLHSLLRKNYGIASSIHDHAGAGTFFHCRACEAIASERTCPHDHDARLELSGTRVREILRSGGQLPRELVRPEVAEILRDHYLADVHAAISASGPAVTPPPQRERPRAKGFIVWFTGLSGAGKSTLAAALAERIGEDVAIDVLDSDEVRNQLAGDRGFSREDRDANIRRIGYVARKLARHGVGVVTAAISPYARTRREVRELAEQQGIGFVEVFAKAELASLVLRDVKGLYKKALSGELEHFTGLSDPYEPPENPDVIVRSDVESIDESLAKIVEVLQARGLIPSLAPVLPFVKEASS